MSKKPYHHGDLKEALLTGAENELNERGVEAFSLRGVAKRAGVSHAAPAHHFGDVNGLLSALAVDGFNQLLSFEEDHQPHQDPREELKLAASAYIDFVEDKAELSKLMFYSNRLDVRDELLAASMEQYFIRLSGLVRKLPEAKGQSEEEIMIAVTAAWSMIHGFASLINSDRLPAPLAQFKPDRDWLIGAFIDQLIGGQG